MSDMLALGWWVMLGMLIIMGALLGTSSASSFASPKIFFNLFVQEPPAFFLSPDLGRYKGILASLSKIWSNHSYRWIFVQYIWFLLVVLLRSLLGRLGQLCKLRFGLLQSWRGCSYRWRRCNWSRLFYWFRFLWLFCRRCCRL